MKKTAALLTLLLVAPALAAPDRTRPPEIGPPPALVLPTPTKVQLSNGLSVWIVNRPKVPLVKVDVMWTSGASVDDPGKAGLANLTAHMLNEGSAGKSSLEISDRLETLGARQTLGCDWDSTSIGITVPIARIGPALDILAEEATHPDFPEAELTRTKASLLTELSTQKDEPTTLCNLCFSRVLYGDERQGTSLRGITSTVTPLNRADLVRDHNLYLTLERAHLVVVGDVTAAQIVPDLEQRFGHWSKESSEPTPKPAQALPSHAGRKFYLVDKPGSAQTRILIGDVATDRRSPDYYPIQVLNTVLGGSFESRLNQNLREKHQYTYGAFSSFAMRVEPGPFAASAGVQTDKTGPALVEFFRELDNIHKPVGEAEMQRAKNYLAYGFPPKFETLGQVAERLEARILFGLPDDSDDQYVPNVLAVTSAQVQAAADKYIQSDRLSIVLVGDRAQIEPQLKAAGLDTPELVAPSSFL
jgi:zinc protease